MLTKTESLPDDISALKNIILSLESTHLDKNRDNKNRIDILEEQVRYLKAVIFGRKSEKKITEEERQLYLFNEIEEETYTSEPEEKIVIPPHTRKKGGRKPLPESFPRVEIVHDLPESEKTCCCGAELSLIGEEVSEKLDVIPAKVEVQKHIRKKYACKSCEGVESEGGAVKTAPLPPQIISQSIATPGLLAYLITSKFVDHLPFYRQEKILKRMSVELSRATMCHWTVHIADQCRPLLNLLKKEIRSGPFINMDETPVQVLKEPGRAATTTSYMWVFRGGDPANPALVYEYHPSRSGEVPALFLGEYEGYIQTDMYKGYDALGKKPGIGHVGCWAHARRNFVNVLNAKGKSKKQGKAEKALKFIEALYAVESEGTKRDFSYEERKLLRDEKSRPILQELKNWLNQIYPHTPPEGLLGKAMAYCLRHWDKLYRYLEDGHIRPDNNLAENAIRPFVLGRKNWLFSGTPKGAESSAAFYSLIETAKANKIEPYRYLKKLFEKLPSVKDELEYEKLLPQFIFL